MDYCTILTCPELYFDSDGVIFVFTFAIIVSIAVSIYYGVKLLLNKNEK